VRTTARGRVHLIACVTLLACGRGAPKDEAPSAAVEQTRIERLVVATGTIEPEKEVEVRPRISGIVEVVHVKAGDRVAANQALVEIDRELLEAQHRESEARLVGSRAELVLARQNFDRAVALRKDGTVAQREHDEASARLRLMAAAVARDEATVESLAVQLRYTTVTAPMAGTILDVDVKEGSAVASVATVTGGTRLLTLAAADALDVKGLVDENEIAHVAVGQKARVRTEAFPGRVFTGRVNEVKPLGNRQQNVTYFEVRVRVDDAEASLLRPRMSADADIVTEVVDDALVVPETALLYDGSEIAVETVVNGGPPARKKVRIGIVDGSRVQVIDGLASGERVRLK
jgi:RND family efflux transporter MFP subunit